MFVWEMETEFGLIFLIALANRHYIIRRGQIA